MAANDQAAGSETTGADYASSASQSPASDATSTPGRGQTFGQSGSTSLKDHAEWIVEEQKSAAAQRIGGVAEATQRAAGDLAREVPQAAEALRAVAERLDSADSALRDRSIDEWISEARDFARRQPLAFFAGAIATGFALSRFLKSSSPRSQGQG